MIFCFARSTCNWQHVHRYDLDCYMSKAIQELLGIITRKCGTPRCHITSMQRMWRVVFVSCCFFHDGRLHAHEIANVDFKAVFKALSKRFPGSFVHFSCRFKHNNVKTSLTSLARNKTQRITYVASWRIAFVCHDVLKFGNHSTTCSNLDRNSARIATHMLKVRNKQTSTYTLFESWFLFCSRNGWSFLLS